MGFRLRKSVNIGPARINLSKSGIGWSVGGKGVRFTQKANGGTQSTFSLPGTGLSFTSGSKSSDSPGGCLGLFILPFKLCWWILLLYYWLFYFTIYIPIKKTYQGIMNNKLWAFVVCSIFFPPGALLAAWKKYPDWEDNVRKYVMIGTAIWSVIWTTLVIVFIATSFANAGSVVSGSDVISNTDIVGSFASNSDVLSNSNI